MPDFGVLHVIDILGTFSFAVSGAFFAMEKKLDPFGVLIISFVTVVIFIGAIGSMFFSQWLKKINNTLFLFDALGLGLFTIIGIEKGLQLDFSVGICIALGTITASFGGVIRDVLLNNVPLIFRKEIYALASIIGGLIYYLLKQTPLNNDVAKIICILLILVIRLLAVKYKFSLPLIYSKNKKNETNDLPG